MDGGEEIDLLRVKRIVGGFSNIQDETKGSHCILREKNKYWRSWLEYNYIVIKRFLRGGWIEPLEVIKCLGGDSLLI